MPVGVAGGLAVEEHRSIRAAHLRLGNPMRQLLRLPQRREQGITGHVPDRFEQLETEAATDHGAERQHLLAVRAHALKAPADDQPHPFGDVQVLDIHIRAPGAVLTVQRSLFLKMLEHLFHEERVPSVPR